MRHCLRVEYWCPKCHSPVDFAFHYHLTVRKPGRSTEMKESNEAGEVKVKGKNKDKQMNVGRKENKQIKNFT